MPEEVVKEMVNHPSHYNQGKYEAIDVIEDWQLDFHTGNTVKYISRYRHKGRPLEDLKKARWYLDRLISKIEEEEGKQNAESSENNQTSA